MNRGLLSGLGVALAVVLALAVNLTAGTLLSGLRVDLTEQRLYTLSDGTREILANLPEPVTLDYYYSEGVLRDLPQVRAYAQRVRALLREYERRADGRITLRVIDPAPFSEAEDAAVQAGLRPLPAGGSGETAYFGIAARNATDREEVLPFLTPATEDTLEYDLTRLIHNLTREGRPRVALVSSLPLAGSMVPMTQQRMPSWAVLDQMRGLFEVNVLGLKFDAIPPDTDVLVVVHPKTLTDKALYQIDQFVLSGGRALVFLDPYSDIESPPRDPMMPTMSLPKEPSDLGELPRAWGLHWDPERVLVDPDAAREVDFDDGRGTRPYPAWLRLDERHVDRGDVVTARLSQLNVPTAGVLEAADGADVEVTPLIQAGPRAGHVPSALVSPPPDLRRIRDETTPAPNAALAVRVRGKLSSAFPDGPPEGTEGAGGGEGGAHLERSAAATNLVVVADSDLLYDRFWAQVQDFMGDRGVMPFADNGTFAINALDNLAGSDALIGVRSQGSYARPFTVVEKLRAQAQENFEARERELEQRLAETDQRLRELQRARGEGQGPLLTPEQQAEIERFRTERVRIGQELRGVQRDLRRDIERLEAFIKVTIIGLVPLSVALFAVLVLGVGPALRRRLRAV